MSHTYLSFLNFCCVVSFIFKKNRVGGRNKNKQGGGPFKEVLDATFFDENISIIPANHKIKKTYSLGVKGNIVLCNFNINLI